MNFEFEISKAELFSFQNSIHRQLILGLTPEFLLMAENQIFSYKENPEVYYDTDADPHLEGLEIMSAFPLCLLELTASMKTYSIMMNYYGRKRYLNRSLALLVFLFFTLKPFFRMLNFNSAF